MKWTEKPVQVTETVKLSSRKPEKFYKDTKGTLYYAMAPRSGYKIFGLAYAGERPVLLSSSDCDAIYVLPEPVHGTLEF